MITRAVLIFTLCCLAVPAQADRRADMASDVLHALTRAHSTWWVETACEDGSGRCYFAPDDGLPSPEACAWYGRKHQLGRKRPMNDFKCVEVKP